MPDRPPPAAPVQRLRVRYARRDRMRFSSHRDFQRALERAVRRAGLPVASSAGFSPHPKISYAGAAPTGAASEAEYLEIAVTTRCEPERFRAALDAALPAGLDVVTVVEAGPGALAARLVAGEWELVMPGTTSRQADDAVERFLAAPQAMVERMTKTGLRRFDTRGAVVRLERLDPAAARSSAARPLVLGGQPCAILRLVVRHTTPAVRPDDVLVALRDMGDCAPASSTLVTRLAQGPLDEANGTVGDPFGDLRSAVGN